MPSQYMNFSSPAPFWKFVDLPSTPAKFPIEFSPTKMHHDEKDNEEDLQPSSPPMLPDDDHSADPEDEDASDDKPGDDEEVGVESPSRTVSRPVSRRDLGGNQRSRSNSNVNILAETWYYWPSSRVGIMGRCHGKVCSRAAENG